jgi:hypothetical protein
VFSLVVSELLSLRARAPARHVCVRRPGLRAQPAADMPPPQPKSGCGSLARGLLVFVRAGYAV